MFEEISRELRKLGGTHRVSIPMRTDEKGFFERQCPSKECRGIFKVLMSDWKAKVSDAKVYCPFCGHASPATQWNTPSQQRYIKEAARAEFSRRLNRAMKGAVQRTRPVQMGGGLFSVSMSLDYRPGRIPRAVPAAVSESLRQDFVCESCNCKYASLGASFFCPACGHNSADSAFDTTLETIRKTVEAIGQVEESIVAAADADTARDATRQIIEDQFPRIVGAFERVSAALFAKLPNASQFPLKGNVFQRIDDASLLWNQATGKGYTSFLDAKELAVLTLGFQKRHVLSHQQGIVDQTYLDKSGDRSYTLGQRLVVRGRDVLTLVEITRKLVEGLRTLP